MTSVWIYVVLTIGVGIFTWVYKSTITLLVSVPHGGFFTERSVSTRLVVPVGAVLLFGTFVVVALIPRLNGQTHVQYTLDATYIVIPAAIAFLASASLLMTYIRLKEPTWSHLALRGFIWIILGACSIFFVAVIYLFLTGQAGIESSAVVSSMIFFFGAVFFPLTYFVFLWKKAAENTAISSLEIVLSSGTRIRVRGFFLTDGTAGPYIIYSPESNTQVLFPPTSVEYVVISQLD